MRKIRDQLTFCSIRNFTERNDPKNIGKSAIKTKLEYATNNPSGVAAALPVTFFAVSFTVAERFATVSFTTDSAILTEREIFCLKATGNPIVPIARGRYLFPLQWSKYTSTLPPLYIRFSCSKFAKIYSVFCYLALLI